MFVPHYAMSGGTLIAMAAQEIIMDRNAVLGPVDPQIGGVAAVAPEARASVTVVANGRNWSTSVIGSTNSWFTIGNWKLASGRMFTDDEQTAGAARLHLGVGR